MTRVSRARLARLTTASSRGWQIRAKPCPSGTYSENVVKCGRGCRCIRCRLGIYYPRTGPCHAASAPKAPKGQKPPQAARLARLARPCRPARPRLAHACRARMGKCLRMTDALAFEKMETQDVSICCVYLSSRQNSDRGITVVPIVVQY